MAQHKSAEKRTRQNVQRHARNKAAAALKIAVKTLDQLASKGVIHKNKAANQKSSLTKYVNTIK